MKPLCLPMATNRGLKSKILQYLEFEIDWLLYLEYQTRREAARGLGGILEMLAALKIITVEQKIKYRDQIYDNVSNTVILDMNDDEPLPPKAEKQFSFEPENWSVAKPVSP